MKHVPILPGGRLPAFEQHPAEPPERLADGRAEPRLPGREARRVIAFKAHVLRGTGEIVDVDVCDLSYDGCKIRTPAYLWPKEQLKLSIPGRGVILCEIRWCTDGFAGLRFEPEEEPEKDEIDRLEERVETRGEVQLRRIGAGNYKVDIHDLSRFGCKVELVERPRLDEVLLVRFDGLEALDARVKWVDGFIAGLQFARPLHVAVFDLLKDRIAAKG